MIIVTNNIINLKGVNYGMISINMDSIVSWYSGIGKGFNGEEYTHIDTIGSSYDLIVKTSDFEEKYFEYINSKKS